MKGRAEVSRLQKRMDATFSRVAALPFDIELQSDYAKYLCVLVSGFLENAIIALTLEFVDSRSSPEILSFVERELKYWTNPNCDKLCQLLGSFNSDWQTTTGDFLRDERKASVNSLVALRHKIAHGESVGTTLSQVKRHYAVVIEVIGFVADLVNPTTKLPLCSQRG